MSLILSGTDGLSDVDGSAATPAIRGTDANTGIFFPAADTIAFAEGGVESMRIDSAGNLGLGVTPSAWTTFTSQQIGPAGGMSLYAGADNVNIGANVYYNAGYKRVGAYAASSYQQGAGAHYWNTAGSSTAGSAISFTTAMTLDASGNLSVGTTSPSFTAGSRGNITVGGSTSAIYALQVGGTAKGYTFHDGTDMTLANDANGYLRFNTNATERARIDSSGNFLLGVTTSTGLTGTGDLAMPNNRAIRFRNAANSAYLNMIYVDGSNNLNFGFGGVPPNITFGINGIGEVSRFDSSGNLLVGTTSLVSAGKIEVATSAATNQGLNIKDTSGSNNLTYCAFFNSSGTVAGTITHTGSTTVAYNTSSDYRLKENIAPMTGALNTVAQLNPVTYTWKEDQTAGQGFIAHELAEVVPDCVTGEKDAVDADGNPKYQGIDTSFLVATLTAAIQEQQALITQLTERITALEAK